MKTDTELIRSVKSGNKDAFNEILRLYEPLIRASILRIPAKELFSASDEEDFYQEAAIALYRAVLSFDLDQKEVTFGLYAKICLHNSLSSVAARRKRQITADQSQDPVADTAVSDAFDNDAGLLLDRINAILTPLERSVLRLYLVGYSHRFIAETLGKSERSVGNAIYRIRAKLSERL